MAAKGIQFLRRWYGGMIFANLEVIWEMSVQMLAGTRPAGAGSWPVTQGGPFRPSIDGGLRDNGGFGEPTLLAGHGPRQQAGDPARLGARRGLGEGRVAIARDLAKIVSEANKGGVRGVSVDDAAARWLGVIAIGDQWHLVRSVGTALDKLSRTRRGFLHKSSFIGPQREGSDLLGEGKLLRLNGVDFDCHRETGGLGWWAGPRRLFDCNDLDGPQEHIAHQMPIVCPKQEYADQVARLRGARKPDGPIDLDRHLAQPWVIGVSRAWGHTKPGSPAFENRFARIAHGRKVGNPQAAEHGANDEYRQIANAHN